MSKTINLGFQVPDYSKMRDCGPVETSSPKETPTKEAFPTMTIRGNRGMARAMQAGQEFTALVKFRVVEVTIRDRADEPEGNKSMDYYGEGTHVDLEAQSITPQGVDVEGEEKEEDGASAFENFRKKRKESKEEEGE